MEITLFLARCMTNCDKVCIAKAQKKQRCPYLASRYITINLSTLKQIDTGNSNYANDEDNNDDDDDGMV